MSLSGKVWPVHFPPENDEALSSWFTRLAVVHFQVPSTFFSKTVPHRRDSWKQDIDVVCPMDVLVALSDRCCQSELTLSTCTLGYWRKHFDPYDGKSTALPRWVSPAYIRKNSLHYRGWKICPLCVSANPYYKLFWRLAFYFSCPIHRRVLIDSCQRCQFPITTHRINKIFHETFPTDGLAYCSNCGFDLRQSKTKIASEFEIEFVSHCIGAVRDGYVSSGHSPGQYAHLYFQGIRLIAKAVARKRLRLFTKSFGHIKKSDFDLEMAIHDEIEFLPVNQIRHLLIISYWLTQDWPNRFLDIHLKYNLIQSDWIRPRDVVPFWILEVVRR